MSKRPRPGLYAKSGRAWYRKNQQREYLKNRNRIMIKSYGLSLEAYNALFDTQNGLCKICGCTSKRRLAVDHCHKTGRIRGLLCFKCNMGLGYFQDNKDLLIKASEYL